MADVDVVNQLLALLIFSLQGSNLDLKVNMCTSQLLHSSAGLSVRNDQINTICS